ncbi:hypothetical protein PIB30_083151 [Stylosanthes scabra]|uniref:Uncharacterized protein n=1 Tax=Stylosanthes scabra TaxID=79078 RepID=A0ABU6XS17_9FABA|nr:hypothetical protein [Stylosanthes scabra]
MLGSSFQICFNPCASENNEEFTALNNTAHVVSSNQDLFDDIDFSLPICLSGSRIIMSLKEPTTKDLKPQIDNAKDNSKETKNQDNIAATHANTKTSIIIREDDLILQDTFSFWPNEKCPGFQF